MTEETDAYIDEVRGEPVNEHAPLGPVVVYEARYYNKKNNLKVIEDVRGFQLDGMMYFLYVFIPDMPVPEIVVLNITSPDVVGLVITPVEVIERDA